MPADASATFWNRVAISERQFNGQFAREFIIALPIEFDRNQHIALASDYVQRHLVSPGFVSDLVFHDETGELAKMHLSRIRYDSGTIRAGAGHAEDVDVFFHLDYGKLNEHFAACQLTKFEGSFLELEPDFDAFVRRFAKLRTLDPKRQRYGRLLNPLARWDWWELGGRFNGAITGEVRAAGTAQYISSGESTGRDVLGNIIRALGVPSNTRNAEIELNVELIETLRSAQLSGEATRFPSAIVLPIGACADEGRWIDEPTWRRVPPSATEFLGVGSSADFGAILGRVYDRFRTHAAAGVAYHF